MWGFNSSMDRNLSNLIMEKFIDKKISQKYNKDNKSPKKADELFLAEHVYPLLVNNSVIHDSFWCKKHKNSSPFPTKRNGTCFVGSNSKFKECMNPTTKQLESFKCPLECRPANHSDWLQC